jgi:hypothetical protein
MMESVADRDSAFLWESEALRAAPRTVVPIRPTPDPVDDWLTLRQAGEMTGVPVPTLRKWALGGNVPSYLEETPVGQLRMVSLEGVYRRAEQLGRQVDTRKVVRHPTVTRPTALSVDLTDEPTMPSAADPAPEGTMLVPLDAWNKILLQLGNLHEAGQQLAEARERAAKAETQAAFLRERLGELREELAQARAPSEPPPAEQPDPSGPEGTGAHTSMVAQLTAYPVAMTRQWVGRWKRRSR